jgi:apolipoprotein N-acyltransferase
VLVLPSLAIVLYAIWNSTPRSALRLGFLFGIGHFGSTLYWVAESFGCVGLGYLGYPAVVCLVLYLSVYVALASYLSRWLACSRVGFLVLFACFWTLAEYARGIVFTGFPWNLMGYITYDITCFSQIATIFGSYGLSFFVVLISASLTTRRTCLYGVAVFFAICVYGYVILHDDSKLERPANQVRVFAVQPSISQADKMDRTKFEQNLDKHIAISDLSGAQAERSIYVWPEAAVDVPLIPGGAAQRRIGELMKSDGSLLITGADRRGENGEVYNGAAVLGNGGEILQTYDKRHLLPFGEFIPEFLLDMGLRKVTPGILNFSSGQSSRTISIDGVEKFNLVICYEIVFPGEILDDRESKWILNITNDAWFNDSDGPSQHMRSACFRAIEDGRAIVRVANNGISCIIDCNGSIVSKLETDAVGVLDTYMPLPYRNTFFSVHKNIPILSLIVALIFIVIAVERTRRKR